MHDSAQPCPSNERKSPAGYSSLGGLAGSTITAIGIQPWRPLTVTKSVRFRFFPSAAAGRLIVPAGRVRPAQCGRAVGKCGIPVVRRKAVHRKSTRSSLSDDIHGPSTRSPAEDTNQSCLAYGRRRSAVCINSCDSKRNRSVSGDSFGFWKRTRILANARTASSGSKSIVSAIKSSEVFDSIPKGLSMETGKCLIFSVTKTDALYRQAAAITWASSPSGKILISGLSF